MDLSYVNLAIQDTSEHKSAIAVKRWVTTLMSVVPNAQCLTTLGVTTVRRPRKSGDVGLTLLRNHSNVVDHQQKVGVVFIIDALDNDSGVADSVENGF